MQGLIRGDGFVLLAKKWVAACVLVALHACGGGGGDTPASGSPTGGGVTPLMPSSVSGTVSGLIGAGLVLTLNGEQDMRVDIDRAFEFPTPLAGGSGYKAEIQVNPPGQICNIVANASGVVGAGAAGDVRIECTTPPSFIDMGVDRAKRLMVGGKVSGLKSEGLVLVRNDGPTLEIPAGSSDFTFDQPYVVRFLASLTVEILSQPAGQHCRVLNGHHSAPVKTVTQIGVVCVDDPSPIGASVGLTLFRDQIDLVAEQGQAVAPQTIRGAVFGATAPVYILVTHTDVGLISASFNQEGAFGGALQVYPKSSTALMPGTYRDTIMIAVCYDRACRSHVPGSPKQIPVAYTVKPAVAPSVLSVSARGVAFTVVPEGQRLTRTLSVSDDAGAEWTAVSDRVWLKAISGGIRGGSLELTADPAGLPNGLHEGTVTVATQGVSGSKPVRVRVGLYISGNASASQFAQLSGIATDGDGEPLPSQQVVDPVRPYFYVTSGRNLIVSHLYTGERVASITLSSQYLGDVVVSDDGENLFVADLSSDEIVVVDLATLQERTRWGFAQMGGEAGGADLTSNDMSYVRLHGNEYLLFTNMSFACSAAGCNVAPFFRAHTGQYVGAVNSGNMHQAFAVSRNGRALYQSSKGLSGILNVYRYELRMNSLGNVFGVYAGSDSGHNTAGLRDMAIDDDGARGYLAFYADQAMTTVTPDAGNLVRVSGWPDASLKGQPSNVEMDVLGRLLVSWVTSMGIAEIRMLDRDLKPLAWMMSGPEASAMSRAGGLRVSGDGLRLIGNGRLAMLPH